MTAKTKKLTAQESANKEGAAARRLLNAANRYPFGHATYQAVFAAALAYARAKGYQKGK